MSVPVRKAHRMVGFDKVNETTLTLTPSNQFAKAVLTKSRTPAHEPGDTDMSIKAVLRVAKMSETTRAFFAGLDEAAATAFIEKSDAEQDAEAKAAADALTATEKTAKEKADLEAAGDPKIVALEKSNAALAAQVQELLGDKSTAAIEKRAKDEFPGVPDAVEVLKSIQTLTTEQQAPILATLKSRMELAAKVKRTYGGDDSEEIGGTAKARLDEVVKTYAKEKSVSAGEALLAITEMAEHQELVAEVRNEELGIAA